MLQKVGFFHFGNPDKSQPLASLEKYIRAGLAENGEDYLRDTLVVLPEAFNLKGEYAPRKGYEVEPSSSVKCRLTQLAKQFYAVFVVGLIDNDEANGPVPPFSSAHLITSACCSRLCRKMGEDDMAKGIAGDKLYQPSPEPSDTPFLYEQKTRIACLLCMDAHTDPSPHRPSSDNRERHMRLRSRLSKIATAPQILCVPAKMRSITTEIEDEWPDVHFVLANSCDPGDSNTHPSVIRIKGQNPVKFPTDQFTFPEEKDAFIVEPLASVE